MDSWDPQIKRKSSCYNKERKKEKEKEKEEGKEWGGKGRVSEESSEESIIGIQGGFHIAKRKKGK